jgi:RNA polymerase sigma factor (sigma-70 family)
VAVTATDPTLATHRAIESIWRMESPVLIAGLARVVRDVGLAEELAQDALVVALEKWPVEGVPDNPAAWLTATAKHRAVDALRRQGRYREKLAELGRDQEQRRETGEPDLDALTRPVADDLLRLVFTACHPVLTPEARVSLTLRLLGGLTTHEIARAFLVAEPTIAQRIVRAKRTLTARGVDFELPPAAELSGRLASVLGVVYLIFNEGYAATAGDDWTRPALCEEALRLGRVLAGLMPDAPEVHGLLALMELQSSRLAARTDASGAAVLLADQDRRRWDRLLIRRGLAALERAEALGGTFGPYTLQAAIAACHARALSVAETDWERVARLYLVLGHVSPSPVVELNRAVAVGMARGPEEELAVLDGLAAGGALDGYALLPAARGDLSPGSAAPPSPERSSPAPPPSPATRANEPCSWPARRPTRPAGPGRRTAPHREAAAPVPGLPVVGGGQGPGEVAGTQRLGGDGPVHPPAVAAEGPLVLPGQLEQVVVAGRVAVDDHRRAARGKPGPPEGDVLGVDPARPPLPVEHAQHVVAGHGAVQVADTGARVDGVPGRVERVGQAKARRRRPGDRREVGGAGGRRGRGGAVRPRRDDPPGPRVVRVGPARDVEGPGVAPVGVGVQEEEVEQPRPGGHGPAEPGGERVGVEDRQQAEREAVAGGPGGAGFEQRPAAEPAPPRRRARSGRCEPEAGPGEGGGPVREVRAEAGGAEVAQSGERVLWGSVHGGIQPAARGGRTCGAGSGTPLPEHT